MIVEVAPHEGRMSRSRARAGVSSGWWSMTRSTSPNGSSKKLGWASTIATISYSSIACPLISPDSVPGSAGFSPRPAPRLIATYKTKEPMLAVSRGLDRDRVVDETGGQTVVFGRRGARPFHVDEMERFYRRSTFAEGKDFKQRKGELYRVEDVTLSGGVLTTKGGEVLTPLAMPTPSPQPMMLPVEPEVE